MVRNKSTPTKAKPKFGETSNLMVLFRLEKAREKKKNGSILAYGSSTRTTAPDLRSCCRRGF